MNKKKIIVVGEPPLLTRLIMTPGFEHKDIFYLDDIKGSLPVLLPPESIMAQINTEINMAKIINPIPNLLLDANTGTCCASPSQFNVDDMIRSLKDLAFEIKPQKLVACDDLNIQVRFPRSKKKRIRKKWAKRPENYADVCFGFGNNMVGHSRLKDQFIKYMEFATKQVVKEGFGFPGYGRFL